MARGITVKQVRSTLSVIHPNLYLDRLGARLQTDGGKLIDALFDIALNKTIPPDLRLKAITKITEISGAGAYLAALATAAAKAEAEALLPNKSPAGGEARVVAANDASTLEDHERDHLKGLLDGEDEDTPPAAASAPVVDAAPAAAAAGRGAPRKGSGSRAR